MFQFADNRFARFSRNSTVNNRPFGSCELSSQSPFSVGARVSSSLLCQSSFQFAIGFAANSDCNELIQTTLIKIARKRSTKPSILKPQTVGFDQKGMDWPRACHRFTRESMYQRRIPFQLVPSLITLLKSRRKGCTCCLAYKVTHRRHGAQQHWDVVKVAKQWHECRIYRHNLDMSLM